MRAAAAAPQSAKSARPPAPRLPAACPPDRRYDPAIPFAAPVPRDYYPGYPRYERGHSRQQPRRFAPMPPSAPPLYDDLQQDPALRSTVGGVPTARYEVAVDVGRRQLQDAWATPPGQQRWQRPVGTARGVIVGERFSGDDAPFLSSGGNGSLGDSSPVGRRRQSRRENGARAGKVWTLASDTARLTVFHLLNACLGFAACSVATSGVSLGLSTLPLCCLGVLVFRILFYVVYAFAQFDMMLGNYIAPPDQFMYAVVPPFDGQSSLTGYRLAPTLACFSPLSLMALLYFCSVKVGVAVLSSAAVVLFLAPPATLVVSLATGYAVPVDCFGVAEVSLQSDPAGFSLSVVVLTLVGFALLHGVASLSLLATRFFVCERFTMYRYPGYPPYYTPGVGGYPDLSAAPLQPFNHRQHHHQYQRHLRPDGHTRRERRPLYPIAVVSYGSASH